MALEKKENTIYSWVEIFLCPSFTFIFIRTILFFKDFESLKHLLQLQKDSIWKLSLSQILIIFMALLNFIFSVRKKALNQLLGLSFSFVNKDRPIRGKMLKFIASSSWQRIWNDTKILYNWLLMRIWMEISGVSHASTFHSWKSFHLILSLSLETSWEN